MFGHLLRNNECMKVITDLKIQEKKKRPRTVFSEQIIEKVKVSSHQEVNELVIDRERRSHHQHQHVS